jgi:hypothetical protein
MRTHKLRRRYGRAKGHLPLSRMSLAEYERELRYALKYLKQNPRLDAGERIIRLRGWENGTKPITLALNIERYRGMAKRGAL